MSPAVHGKMRREQQMANDSSPRSAADGTDAGLQERRVTAWIGKSLRIDGHIVSDDNLTIDGNVEGTIGVGDYSLTVGPGATVKADLTARKITVSGAVIGKVRAHELLDLRATGSVVGEIVAGRLRMADGAVIDGPVDAGGARLGNRSSPP
jgi:cytoskeletal protein CcmA (bactofilin family)